MNLKMEYKKNLAYRYNKTEHISNKVIMNSITRNNFLCCVCVSEKGNSETI